MINIEKTKVTGWEEAVRGMRNSFNSWDKSDSLFDVGYWITFDAVEGEGSESAGLTYSGSDIFGKAVFTNKKFHDCGTNIGPNDMKLMQILATRGHAHAKYRRMIIVYCDITAPLYWWKEFDTYKVGTVANSCSTMHKIAEREFDISDFSHEHLLNINDLDDRKDFIIGIDVNGDTSLYSPTGLLKMTIQGLNTYRRMYLETKDKKYWWQLIQLLPTSYNQKRTVMMNYEVLAGIYKDRKGHRLDEWEEFRKWIKELPYSELITGGEEKED